VSSTAAIWYFEEGEPSTPVLRSFCRVFYHLGSIAFGSLLIAIVMAVRIVLEYINVVFP
jgi:solute carrier family 44 (choline transporter-like protein), member 2/4/5